MGKYLVKRLIHGIISIVVVIFIVMLLVYGLIDRQQIFAHDPNFTKLTGTNRTLYMYQQWERYGYLDYVPYADYLDGLVANGELDSETRSDAVRLGSTPENDSETTQIYVALFTDYYESQGYEVMRIDAVRQGATRTNSQLFAYRDLSIFSRLWNYITNLVRVDNIHYASGIPDEERGLSFTWYDPVYGGDTFSPAIMGNGTRHKYLLYFDNQFPFIHQNLITLQLGVSYSINQNVDVWNTMTDEQGNVVSSSVTYPTGYVAETADDLHSATYSEGSLAAGGEYTQLRYEDDYTVVTTNLDGMSRMSYSFIIGIISVVLAYFVGIPLGIVMARRKDGVVDKLGTIYIIFIMAVPSLAYIFMFQSIGGAIGLPTTFSLVNPTTLMWILPIISLALPSIANLMKWMRRYMIDQRNSDYVKFARAGGLSEGEISRKHIMKNAAIPLVHNIPASVLGALTGAIITESVYVVPGVGNLLTRAINAYDNSVIVGVTLFYAVLSVIAIILGDILMALMDPRISFSSKGR